MARIGNRSVPALARMPVGPLRRSCLAGGGGAVKWSSDFGKQASSEKVRYIYDPVPFLRIYLREMKI